MTTFNHNSTAPSVVVIGDDYEHFVHEGADDFRVEANTRALYVEKGAKTVAVYAFGKWNSAVIEKGEK